MVEGRTNHLGIRPFEECAVRRCGSNELSGRVLLGYSLQYIYMRDSREG